MTPETSRRVFKYGWKIFSIIALAGLGAAVMLGIETAGRAYRVSDAMTAAWVSHDGRAVAALIDFPVLRANLTDEFVSIVGRRLENPDTSSVAEQAMVKGYVASMVASLATPERVAALVDGMAKLDLENVQTASPQGSSRGFRDTRHFVVWISGAESGQGLALVYARFGMDWKLANVEFPRDAFPELPPDLAIPNF